MLRYVLNICLITIFVVHLVNADVVKQNRRTKRLGTGGRNATNKFKKGEQVFVNHNPYNLLMV